MARVGHKIDVFVLLFQVRARLQKMGAYAPMNIFLKQEIDRMQRVITAVRQTLTDLKLAIDGTIIMNETLRDALDCMYDARIPEHWKKVSKMIWFLNDKSSECMYYKCRFQRCSKTKNHSFDVTMML